MPPPKLSDAEFIELYQRKGPAEITRATGLAYSNINQRRRRIEERTGISILGPGANRHSQRIPAPAANHRIELNIKEGCVFVLSDAHYWPGEETAMHRAAVRFIKDMKPRALILNGDVMDLPKISRHARIGWEHRPEVHEEIEWAQEKTHELRLAAPPGCDCIWNLGNHDARFETRLANLAPEYAKINGMHLRDHFPDYRPAWSTYINKDTLIKHRFRGGLHAVHNNLLWGGVNIVTGHLHSAQVRALTLYDERTIWGIDTGCVAEPSARTFIEWTEDNPKNWRSGFAILTFKEGRLMQPELVLKWDAKRVQFRGEICEP